MAAAAHSKKQTRHELQLMSWEQTAKNSRTNQHATTCSSPRDYAKLGTTVYSKGSLPPRAASKPSHISHHLSVERAGSHDR